ncbi:MAG: hypothetical protein HYU62_06365 [Caulobacterales bacterium]|nr:hypothetical protein [Caulobacterales bacterium]
MRKLAGGVAGMALMAGSGAAWAQVQSDKPVTTLSIPEVRALVVETGGAPGEVEHTKDDEYRIEATYPDGLYIQFEGWSCTGEGEAKRCAELMMNVDFEFDSEAEALAMEHEVNIVWLSDMATGNRLKVWRMDYLAGMTRGRMRGMVETFLDAVGAARDIAFPAKDGATAAAKGD